MLWSVSLCLLSAFSQYLGRGLVPHSICIRGLFRLRPRAWPLSRCLQVVLCCPGPPAWSCCLCPRCLTLDGGSLAVHARDSGESLVLLTASRARRSPRLVTSPHCRPPGPASTIARSGHALPRGFNLAGPGSSFLVSGGLPSLFWTLDSFPRATTPGGLDQCPLESPAFCRLPPFPVQWPQESSDLGRSVTGCPASEQTLLGTHSLPRA